jgi:hypothetical protein
LNIERKIDCATPARVAELTAELPIELEETED